MAAEGRGSVWVRIFSQKPGLVCRAAAFKS